MADDTGLGLDSFLGEGKKEVLETETSPEEEKQEVSETEEPSLEAAEEKPDEEPEEKVGEIAESEEGEEETDVEVSVYESEDNPYKKQVTDTRTWANNLNQQKIALEKEVQKLRQQADGTWDEAEANGPSPEEVADLTGRLKASYETSKDQYGADYILENIDSANSPFQKMRAANPAIDARVTASPAPYMEAVKILREEQFFSKYGRNPDKIVENISKEVESKLRAKITKEFQTKLKAKESVPGGLSEARGSQLNNEKKDKAPAYTPLGEILAQ